MGHTRRTAQSPIEIVHYYPNTNTIKWFTDPVPTPSLIVRLCSSRYKRLCIQRRCKNFGIVLVDEIALKYVMAQAHSVFVCVLSYRRVLCRGRGGEGLYKILLCRFLFKLSHYLFFYKRLGDLYTFKNHDWQLFRHLMIHQSKSEMW